MTEEEIFAEIRNVFKKPMGNNDDFRFSILQHTGGGSKTLTIPQKRLHGQLVQWQDIMLNHQFTS